MRIGSVDSTDLFVGVAAQPLQIVRVTLVNEGPGMVRDPRAVVSIRVRGRQADTPEPAQVTGLTPGSVSRAR